MKYSIHGYNQEVANALGLDDRDLLLLRWFSDFSATGKMKKKIVENEVFYWLSYDAILEDLPILKIRKARLAKIFKELTNKKILNSINVYERGCFTYYSFSERYEKLVYIDRKNGKSKSVKIPSKEDVYSTKKSSKKAIIKSTKKSSKIYSVKTSSKEGVLVDKNTEAKINLLISNPSTTELVKYNTHACVSNATENQDVIHNYNVFNNYNNNFTYKRTCSDGERAAYKNIYKSFFENCFSIERKDAAIEIIDVMILAHEQSNSNERLRFNKVTYDGYDFIKILSQIDVNAFQRLITAIVNTPDIKERAFYILGCIINMANDRINNSKKGEVADGG